MPSVSSDGESSTLPPPKLQTLPPVNPFKDYRPLGRVHRVPEVGAPDFWTHVDSSGATARRPPPPTPCGTGAGVLLGLTAPPPPPDPPSPRTLAHAAAETAAVELRRDLDRRGIIDSEGNALRARLWLRAELQRQEDDDRRDDRRRGRADQAGAPPLPAEPVAPKVPRVPGALARLHALARLIDESASERPLPAPVERLSLASQRASALAQSTIETARAAIAEGHGDGDASSVSEDWDEKVACHPASPAPTAAHHSSTHNVEKYRRDLDVALRQRFKDVIEVIPDYTDGDASDADANTMSAREASIDKGKGMARDDPDRVVVRDPLFGEGPFPDSQDDASTNFAGPRPAPSAERVPVRVGELAKAMRSAPAQSTAFFRTIDADGRASRPTALSRAIMMSVRRAADHAQQMRRKQGAACSSDAMIFSGDAEAVPSDFQHLDTAGLMDHTSRALAASLVLLPDAPPPAPTALVAAAPAFAEPRKQDLASTPPPDEARQMLRPSQGGVATVLDLPAPAAPIPSVPAVTVTAPAAVAQSSPLAAGITTQAAPGEIALARLSRVAKLLRAPSTLVSVWVKRWAPPLQKAPPDQAVGLALLEAAASAVREREDALVALATLVRSAGPTVSPSFVDEIDGLCARVWHAEMLCRQVSALGYTELGAVVVTLDGEEYPKSKEACTPEALRELVAWARDASGNAGCT